MSIFIENNPSHYKSTYNDIFSELNKYNQFSILEKISESLWSFHKNHSIGDRNINILSINLLMIVLLDENFSLSNSKKNIMNQEFLEINLMANSASDLEDENTDALTIWYIQTHYNQVVLNPHTPFYKMVLFILLFCKVDEIQVVTLHKYFIEYFGSTGEDVGTALWTIFAFFSENRKLKNLEKCGIKDIEILRKVLDLFSCNLENLRKLFHSSPKYKSMHWKAKFNPFRDYPIIKENIDGENHYWIPSPHFLHLLNSDNLYYYMFQYFFEKEKKENKKNKDPGKNPFSVEFGKTIENIVFKFTSYELSHSRDIIPEFEFISKNGSNAYSADLQILENKSKNLCMIQIKGKRVRLSSQGGDINSYLEDIDKSLIFGIEQNYSLISQREYIESIENKSRWKFNLKNITFLIIYVEGFYDITFPETQKYIENKIHLIQKKLDIKIKIPTAYISLEHYIRLVEWSASDNRSISDKIKDYNKYLENPSKTGNLGGSGFRHLFDEYIRIKTRSQNYPSSLSKKLYDKFIKEIKGRIVPQGI